MFGAARIERVPYRCDRASQIRQNSKCEASLKQIHSWMRFVAGVFFWLNASGMYRPAPTPAIEALARRLGIEFASVSIILGLLAFSLLSLYGLKNALLSAIYIYTFPFILAWQLSRYIVRLIRWLHKGVRTALPSSADEVPFSELLPLWRTATATFQKTVAVTGQPPASGVAASAVVSAGTKDEKESVLKMWLRILSIVLGRSTLLSGFLIVASSVRALVIVGLVMTSIGLIRVNILFVMNVVDVKRMTTYVHANFVKWIDAATEAAHNQINSGAVKENPTSRLLVWKFMLNIVSKAREVPELLTVGGLFLFAASYVWISSVFYFLYLGIAKLTIGKTDWPQWLDSFLFPVLGRNIAHTPILTSVVVLHWIEMVALVYVLWTYLATEIERFRKGMVKYETIIDKRISLLETDKAATSAVSTVQSGGGAPLEEQPQKRGRAPRGRKYAKQTKTDLEET
jgi:hypothetical protein